VEQIFHTHSQIFVVERVAVDSRRPQLLEIERLVEHPSVMRAREHLGYVHQTVVLAGDVGVALLQTQHYLAECERVEGQQGLDVVHPVHLAPCPHLPRHLSIVEPEVVSAK
jgi:hypothetical protein